ncbi:MAG: glucose-1-phosphate thymidylyltransferase [Saprospirales bacterium]|nr:MAG: glucose-1-phosphate thymidylyltransferase [Saprospirales bacterium]
MRNLIFFDDSERDHLLPFTYSRPVCELRFGILKIREKWEHDLVGKGSYITQDYLAEKYPINISNDNYVISGSVIPNERLVKLISQLNFNEALLSNEDLIAARLNKQQFDNLMNNGPIDELVGYELTTTPVRKINSLPDLLKDRKEEFEIDFERITKGRKSAAIPKGVNAIHPEKIFIEEGAQISHSVLNATEGSIYIGKNVLIMEGSFLRGPIGLGEGTVAKMGTYMYGPLATGPHCKIGGELNDVTMIGYSNKTHHGFLGHSYIGEWCNIGAGSSNSNLKNTYSNVRLWNYPSAEPLDTGLLFCGLFMADHTKCGINTTFNTGTVVGYASNLYGPIMHPRFIPSFSWGGGTDWETHKPQGALNTAKSMMMRRGLTLSAADEKIFIEIFNISSPYRVWENKGKKTS